MYKASDRTAAIKQIQIYLNEIYRERGIVPNGIYDTSTESGVKDFQSKHGLADVGVDYITHTLLYREYLKQIIKKRTDARVGSLIRFPICYGDFGDHVLHVNGLLSDILNRYGIHHAIKKNRYFSKDSAKATADIRKIFLLDGGEHIDQLLYERLLREHKLSDAVGK